MKDSLAGKAARFGLAHPTDCGECKACRLRAVMAEEYKDVQAQIDTLLAVRAHINGLMFRAGQTKCTR